MKRLFAFLLFIALLSPCYSQESAPGSESITIKIKQPLENLQKLIESLKLKLIILQDSLTIVQQNLIESEQRETQLKKREKQLELREIELSNKLEIVSTDLTAALTGSQTSSQLLKQSNEQLQKLQTQSITNYIIIFGTSLLAGIGAGLLIYHLSK